MDATPRAIQDKNGERRMKEFLSEHWILVFALFMYAMGFLNGYLNGIELYVFALARVPRSRLPAPLRGSTPRHSLIVSLKF